jgi:hypothetical protein
MSMLWDLLNTWTGWFGLGAGTLGLGLTAAWFLGAMPVIGSIFSVLAAFLAPIFTAIGQGLVWVWQNVFWPGLKDILDDWVTIVTVLTLGAFLYFAAIAGPRVELMSAKRNLNQCQVELTKTKRRLPPEQSPSWELPWPFRW